jgi:hypothetical protein
MQAEFRIWAVSMGITMSLNKFLILIAIPLLGLSLIAQDAKPSVKLKLGTPQSVVAVTYGKPFERWNLTPEEHSAQVGAPLGIWQVWHLTAPPDRMYVTMVHFDTVSQNSSQPTSGTIDSIMLMANGHWTVLQTLNDHPELAAICDSGCKVIRTEDEAGNNALLLVKQTEDPIAIFFEGDSAERPEWRAVSDLRGIPSWVYVLRMRDFNVHHPKRKDASIGEWKPSR